MTETAATSIDPAIEADVIIEVLSQALDSMQPVEVDLGHMLGDETPERNFSLTSNWGSADNLILTLWDEDTEGGAVEIGTFNATIRRVI